MLQQMFHGLYMKLFSRALHCSGILQFKSQCTIEKRGKMLLKLIQNNSKLKKWDFQVGATGVPDQNIYDKVPRPHKRSSVLNSLFMRNITDVLSTGDVCPDIMGYGVEITGVCVTSDYQIVNVFWQIPDVAETCNTNVEILLAKSAPQIRGELIKRNVLGKVPRIYFIRDPTNKRAAEFERCLEASGVSKIEGHPTIPAEHLLKNMFKFPDPRDDYPVMNTVTEAEKPKETVVSPVPLPEKPPNMKFDVMGLDHEKILKQVLMAKRKSKQMPSTTSSSQHRATEDGVESKSQNIVYSIPASPLVESEMEEREKQLKKFYTDRKAHWARINSKQDNVETSLCDTTLNYGFDDDDADIENFEEDYLDDEENQDTGDR